MGVYVYHLSVTPRSIIVDGERVEAHLLAYSRKPSAFDRDREKIERMQAARFEKLWRYKPTPRFVVLGHIRPHAEVYTDWPQGMLEWWDTEPVPALMVGKLCKQGRGHALKRVGNVTVPVWTTDNGKRLHEMAKGWWRTTRDHECRDRVRIYCEDETDLVLAKLISG